MSSEININNYRKFIQLASNVGNDVIHDTNDPAMHPQQWVFDAQALARIVDIAYCEGQIKELTRDDSYADDPEKIDRLGALQALIENALPEDFIETE